MAKDGQTGKMVIEINDNDKKIRISFSATLENVDRVAERIKEFIKKAGIKEEFNMILCTREALINAVTHGSRKDNRKTVTLRLQLSDRNLVLEVEDEGNGFDWRNRLKKKLPTNEESGRGLAIMKNYFSTVEYNEDGNRLRLTMPLQSCF